MVDSPSQTRLNDFGMIVNQPDHGVSHENTVNRHNYCKILITGPHQAGKTSFIRQLDDQALCMDRTGGAGTATIGFDFTSFYWVTSGQEQHLVPKRCIEQIEQERDHVVPVHFYGMPGLRHFSTVREILSQKSDAVILMIDSTNPQQLAEIKTFYDEIQRIKSPDTLVVIAANKQDMPSAVSATDLQRILGTDLPVIPLSTVTREGIQEIITFIMTNVSPLFHR